jgi:hypothetical protein
MSQAFTSEEHRANRIIKSALNDYDLNLSGLTVYTEAATGPYLYSPILAASAGAKHVYAVTDDSRYGTKEEVQRLTNHAAQKWDVENRITVTFDTKKTQISDTDIITNSGFVRPISEQMVSWAKKTAVVPLMYEPWEFRPDDIALDACVDHDILVMGLDEGAEPLSIYPYGGFLGVKLLFNMGIEGYKNSVLLIGGGIGFGHSMHESFTALGISTEWFADGESEARPYSELQTHLRNHMAEYDAIVIAEHDAELQFIGADGIVTARELKQQNPALRIGVVAGQVDQTALDQAGLDYYPDQIRGYGYQSYQPSELGLKPPLELYAAGLRVGEIMARHRLSGCSVGRTSLLAERNPLAVPLENRPFRSVE